ncbi:MAG: hypothetical protein C0592_10500 [Marinilabiliales bacterium]|nr:MAG: hypothetical protein C0592_10500 [Marinilabiliales bacterium]
MLKKILIRFLLFTLLIIIALGSWHYYNFTQKKKAYEKIQKIVKESAQMSFASPSELLENYFQQTHIVPVSLLEYLNDIELSIENIEDEDEKLTTINWFKDIFSDPWAAEDSAMFMVLPVFSRNQQTPVGNVVLSTGIDGKMNFSVNEKLYDYMLSDSLKFYNYDHFGRNDTIFYPREEKLLFHDYLFGQKDYIITYVNYYQCHSYSITKNIAKRHLDLIRNTLEMDNWYIDVIYVWVTHFKGYDIHGYLLGDTNYHVEATLFHEQPCDSWTIHRGSIIELDALFLKFDSTNKTIFFEKGFVYPLNLVENNDL